jgi:hypothetical protein
MEKRDKDGIAGGIMRRIWEHIHGTSFQTIEIQTLKEKCGKLIPDSEKYSTIFVSSAIKTVESIYYTLVCCENGDAMAATGAAEAAYETVRRYLYEVTDPILEVHEDCEPFNEWVNRAPLLQSELIQQQSDIDLLCSCHVLNNEILHKLLKTSVQTGIRPFQRGLLK